MTAIYPDIIAEDISKIIGISERTVYKYFNELQETKLIPAPLHVDFTLYSIPCEMELNRQQLAAVTTANRPLLTSLIF